GHRGDRNARNDGSAHVREREATHRSPPRGRQRPQRTARGVNNLDDLVRDLDRVESVRAVKDLERHYAHYRQAGRWQAMAALFTTDGVAHHGDATARGRRILDLLSDGAPEGLPSGALATEFIDQPLITLAS